MKCFFRFLVGAPDPDIALHRAGYDFMAKCLQANLSPNALLIAIERQREPTAFDVGAADCLKANPGKVRALLARHYG